MPGKNELNVAETSMIDLQPQNMPLPTTTLSPVIGPAAVEVLDSVPERLTGENASLVARATGEHAMLFAGSQDPEAVRRATTGATRRLLASLVAAGELRPDFDGHEVVQKLDAIKDGGAS